METPFGLRRAYHAMTRDWITNEIFRRIEPQGRTMGEYFLQELTKKDGVLENSDIYLGVPENQLSRIYDLNVKEYFRSLDNHFLPHSLGCDSNFSFYGLIKGMAQFGYRSYLIARDGVKCGGFDMKFPNFETGPNLLNGLLKFNERSARMGETGSSNFHASARGLGKLSAFMANGGSF